MIEAIGGMALFFILIPCALVMTIMSLEGK